MFTQPMLACSLLSPEMEHNDETIFKAMQSLKKWPKLVTLKMDGVRGLRMDLLRSRRLKMIPNQFLVQRAFSLPVGYDMELWNPTMDYNDIQSIVMSEEHPDSDKIEFHVLDDFSINGGYLERVKRLWYDNSYFIDCFCLFREPQKCESPQELFEFEQKCIEQHGEGICFRTPDSPYKQGRSTLKEEYLIKLARQVKEEAVIIGFEEQFENCNSEKRDLTGKMNRASFKAEMQSKGTLGAFLVQNTEGLRYKVGGGKSLTNTLRERIYLEQDKYLRRTIVVRSKAHGKLIKPRSPQFWGFRDEMDV